MWWTRRGEVAELTGEADLSESYHTKHYTLPSGRGCWKQKGTTPPLQCFSSLHTQLNDLVHDLVQWFLVPTLFFVLFIFKLPTLICSKADKSPSSTDKLPVGPIRQEAKTPKAEHRPDCWLCWVFAKQAVCNPVWEQETGWGNSGTVEPQKC